MIVINRYCSIGENCKIFQGVTIGRKRENNGGVPKIGNNVVLCSNAQIIGNITVGNYSIAGSVAVIISNIPESSIAVGVLAKVVSYEGKQQVSLYL